MNYDKMTSPRSNDQQKRRWQRFTFSNLDKYKIVNQLMYNKFKQLDSQREYSQMLRQHSPHKKEEEIFPKKSPIMKLIEVNGKLPKAKKPSG